MNVLFLDVDGVLNSLRTFNAWGPAWISMVEDNENPKFDPVAVDILRKVVEDYNYQIVLSSTWRFGYVDTPKFLCQIWKNTMSRWYNWPDFPIIGCTPDLPNQTRGVEIQKWLEQTPAVDHYIILDDNSDMLPEQVPNFYQTTFAVGIDSEFIIWVDKKHGKDNLIVT